MKNGMKKMSVLLAAFFFCAAANAEDVQCVESHEPFVTGNATEQVGNSFGEDTQLLAWQMTETSKVTPGWSGVKTGRRTADNPRDRKGYRGFVEIGGVAGTGDYGDGVFALQTSHGYQFSPHFFLGGGLGIDYHFDWETVFVPIFADLRVYFMDNWITPLLGMKIGYSPFDGSGFYFNPSVGASFAVTNRSAVYLTLGYNLQKSEIYFWNSYLSFTEKATIGGISIKLGVEF